MLSSREYRRLSAAAYEIQESMSAHGGSIDAALDQHQAFRGSRSPASALARELVKSGARRGSARGDMQPHDVGGGLELVSMEDATIRTYRVKVVYEKSVDGSYDFVCGAGSALLAAEPPGIFAYERWILGVLLDQDDWTVEEVIAARIIGNRGEGPVHLELGPIHRIDPSTPPLGFSPGDDDELPGFDDGEGDLGDVG